MGLFDFVEDVVDGAGDFVSDIGDGIVAAAEAVGEGFVDAGEAVGEGFVDGAQGFFAGVGDAGGYLGDAIDWTATALDDASFGIAGESLNLFDDVLFDPVDYVSGGLIDVDFDDGTFSAAVGIDDVFGAGVSIGEHGVTGEFDTLVAGTELGVTDEGFLAESYAGVDFGPLPYAEGHTSVSDDGEISINGRAQATIPTPIGLVGAEVDGGFVKTDQGWGTYVNADGSLTLPSGTYVGANVGVNYAETPDGNVFGVEAGGRLGQVGVGEVGVGVEYDRVQQGDDVVEHVGAQAYGEGYGFEAQAGVDYTTGTVGGTEFESFDAGASVSGYGKSISGEVSYDEVTKDGVTVSRWESDLDVEGFDEQELKDLGTSLLGSAAGPEVAAVLGTVTEQGRLDDFLGALDPDQTAGLIGRLVGVANPAAVPLQPLVDAAGVAGTMIGDELRNEDVLGTAAMSGPSDLPEAERRSPEDEAVADDLLGDDGASTGGVETAGVGSGDAGTSEPAYDEPAYDEPAFEEPAPEEPAYEEPVAVEAPVDEFETTIAAADEVESDVDAMFEDLG